MSWLSIVLISHFLFAIVFAMDKVLVKQYLSPRHYAAVIGILEGLAILLIPFVDFKIPSSEIIALSFVSGVGFVLGIYCYFKALEHEETSWAAPLLFGVLVPLVSFGINYIVLEERLSSFQIIAFFFLVLGGLVLSIQRNGYQVRAFSYLVLASVLISADFTALKVIFNETNFISGYIVSRAGGFLVALLLGFSSLNFAQSVFKKNYASYGALLGIKQLLSFLGNFLLIYTVSLASPTLVNASSGTRYVFLLFITVLFSYKWPAVLDEKKGAKAIFRKSLAILFILLGLLFLSVTPLATPGARVWGVTYSSIYAKQFGYDSKELFSRITHDLGVKEFRLVAYWSEVEPNEGVYDFDTLDFEMNTIHEAGGRAILALGLRLPRWPECFEPEWANSLSIEMKHEKLLRYIETTVNRYKTNQEIWAWQIENEPFLHGFGECTKTDSAFLDKEIALVKSLDNRPVIISDSGELGKWYAAYKRGDIFGTTMYRTIWSKYIPGGYFTYPLPPAFFNLKAGLMKTFWGEKEIVGIELQAEPWTHERPWDTPLAEQLSVFDVENFKENIDYASRVGFEKNYLWGVEWWWWMKDKQNHPEFWGEAKNLFIK